MDPFIFRVAISIAIANGFCWHPPTHALHPPSVDIALSTTGAPYEWSGAEKRQFLEKLRQVKRGDPIKEVVMLLGPPFDVKPVEHVLSDDITGTYVSYFMKKTGGRNGVNELQDEYIEIEFDINNRLVSINTNLKGLTLGSLTGVNSHGAASEKLTEQSAQSKKIRPLFFLSGSKSVVRKPMYSRVETDEAWSPLWAKHLGTSADDPYRAIADVDFTRCIVIVMFRGDEINVRGIKCDSIQENANSIVIRLNELTYGTAGADSHKPPDQPYAFAVIPKTDKPIVLEENTQSEKGQPPIWKACATLTKDAQKAKSKM